MCHFSACTGYNAYTNLGDSNPPYPTVFVWGGDLAYDFVGYKSEPTYTWMRVECNIEFTGTGQIVVYEANFTQDGTITIVANSTTFGTSVINGASTGSFGWALDSIPSSNADSAFRLETTSPTTVTWSYYFGRSPSASFSNPEITDTHTTQAPTPTTQAPTPTTQAPTTTVTTNGSFSVFFFKFEKIMNALS